MSLFGSSPPAEGAPKSRPEQKSSLFDDDQAPAAKANGGLFDNDTANGDSPWDMPTPKKASKGDLLKTLLPASAVPESYIDAFDTLGASEYKSDGGKVSIGGLRRVLEGSRVSTDEQKHILDLVTGGEESSGIGRNEFNVLMALVGLTQENEEASLDSVDERRSSKLCPRKRYRCIQLTLTSIDLPEPSMPFINQLRTTKVSETLQDTPPKQKSGTQADQATPSSTPAKSRRLGKDVLDNLDEDPWASPVLHKGHTHTVNNDATPSHNAITAAKPTRNALTEPSRTTSAFTTHSEDRAPNESTAAVDGSAGGSTGDGGGTGWGSYGSSGGGFPAGQSGLGGGGFGSGGDGQDDPTGGGAGRSLGGGRVINHGVEENITVTLMPEKEGMFMFQHHNYEVKSTRRGSAVIRRYSDFVWLLDCLHKRFPFRQLPLLPPKRVGGMFPFYFL